MTKNILRKAMMYVRHLDSEQLEEIIEFAGARYKDLNSQVTIYYVRLDKNRIFWGIWSTGSVQDGYNPIHTDIIRREKEQGEFGSRAVERAAEKYLGRKLHKYLYEVYVHDNLRESKKSLKAFYRKQLAQTKAKRPKPETTEAKPVDYLYTKSWVDGNRAVDWLPVVGQVNSVFNFGFRLSIVKHRIIKTTAKKVFISDMPQNMKQATGYLVKTISLNRSELEDKGKIYHSGKRKFFYREKWQVPVDANQLLDLLGICKDVPPAEVKSAYRKAIKENHPDTGGDAERFRRIQEAYELYKSLQ